MGKEKVFTNSFDYVNDFKAGVDANYEKVAFNIYATAIEKKAAETNGINASSRRSKYFQQVFPFLEGFNPQKFIQGFGKENDSERLAFLREPQNSKGLDVMMQLVHHSELMISDIKYVGTENFDAFHTIKDARVSDFKVPNNVDKEIRLQAALYKPILEMIKCMSDMERYKAGEASFTDPKLTAVNKGKKGRFTDEQLNIDVSDTGRDTFDAREKKAKLYDSLQKTNMRAEPVTDKQIRKYGEQANQAVKYINQHHKIRFLDPKAGPEIDKAKFEKQQLSSLCDQLKATDPAYVVSNTAEFKKMRDFAYSLQKNSDSLTPEQKVKAFTKLKELTSDYIKPRREKYNEETMNGRSRSRFEIASKISVLCDLAKSDYVPVPEFAAKELGLKKESTINRTAENRIEYTPNRPHLP